MKIAVRIVLSVIALYVLLWLFWPSIFSWFLFGGKHSGYQKVDGKWSYLHYGGSGWVTRELGVDQNSFVAFSDIGYAKDKDTVFFEGRPVPKADASTFSTLDKHYYGRDKSNIWLWGRAIDGVDVYSFKLIKGSYGRDRNTIFCGNVPMNVQRKDTFEVVQTDSQWDGHLGQNSSAYFGTNDWARDGEFYYCGPAKVEGADYQSFRIIYGGWAQDKFRSYWGAKPDELPKGLKKQLEKK